MVEGQASEGEPATSPGEYVEQLRKENAERRKRAEELEGRNAWPVAGLPRAEVVADGPACGASSSLGRAGRRRSGH